MNFVDEISGRYGDDYIGEFRSVLEVYAPNASSFLEWGSGETTAALCEIAKGRPNPFVMSIDHVPEYQDLVASSMPMYPFLHFRCLDLQGPSLSQSDQYPSYSSYPFMLGMRFDVIFVDGRRRSECALTAAQITTTGGIVIVHDWRRSRYLTFRSLYDTIYEGKQFLVLKPKHFMAPQTLNPPTESKVILVPARGQRAERELELTLPFTQDYAKAIGADCFVIGNKSSVPATRLKGEALEIATSYDRALVIDADIIIRNGSPNIFEIVPEDCLGVYPEGRTFPREAWCHDLNELYGLDDKLGAEEYFNTGVMVFSRQHYILLNELRTGIVYGHPQFEQGFMNVKRKSLGLKTFLLTPDFNYIPNIHYQPIDWRNAFFYHLAGSGKKTYHFTELWASTEPELKSFRKRQYISADTRYGALLQTCDQIRGKRVLVFDPTDLAYHEKLARPIYDDNGSVVVHFLGMEDGLDRPLTCYGPYATLEEGVWQVEFLDPNNKPFVYQGAGFDVVHDSGRSQIYNPSEWPQDGKFVFELDAKAQDVEIRIFGAQPAHGLAYIRVEKIVAKASEMQSDGGYDLSSSSAMN
ncbi:hypothetical protein [Methylorubrum aminovorans]